MRLQDEGIGHRQHLLTILRRVRVQGFLPALILLLPIEAIDEVGLPLVFHLLPIQTDVGRVLRSLDSGVAGLRNPGRTISLKLLIW